MKVNEGRIGNANEVLVSHPTIELFDVEVQHPVGAGSLSLELGTIGAGVAMQPNGKPRVLLIVTHPDKTALTVILQASELNELLDMLADANRVAHKAERNSMASTRQ